MGFLTAIAMALTMSYFGMLIFKKTPLAHRFTNLQLYLLCVSIYMSLEAASRFFFLIG